MWRRQVLHEVSASFDHCAENLTAISMVFADRCTNSDVRFLSISLCGVFWDVERVRMNVVIWQQVDYDVWQVVSSFVNLTFAIRLDLLILLTGCGSCELLAGGNVAPVAATATTRSDSVFAAVPGPLLRPHGDCLDAALGCATSQIKEFLQRQLQMAFSLQPQQRLDRPEGLDRRK